MRSVCLLITIITTLISCSNTSDFEVGEIEAIKAVKETLIARNSPRVILDTRKVITRKKIDDAKIPVLFVELENDQNGTLTLYPGVGIGETWLGADGATITLEKGIIKATRGMRNDLMGSKSSMPPWSDIGDESTYSRQISYLGGDNQIYIKTFLCSMKKHKKKAIITVFDVPFETNEWVEVCSNESEKLKNIYFLDNKNVVRRSKQYHGPTLGYLLIERLERYN